jgi:penicillin amidase
MPRKRENAGSFRAVRRLTLLPLLALAGLLPVPAHGAVINAEAILPPGQSGHVSITGLTSGTGSPHLYDQTQPFAEFDWKPFTFQAGSGEIEPKPGVRITRDAAGVPTINASTMEDAWWGVGYAVAQDRLFQLELFQRATTGRLAEIVGKDYLDDDIVARRDYYTDAERLELWRKSPPELQARGQALRDGVNTYVAEARLDPSKLPGEFVAVGIQPSEMTEAEQAAIGLFLARTVPSGDGRELENLLALRESGPKALNALLPLRRKRETYTVPPREGTFPNQPGRTRKQERRALQRTMRVSAGWDVPQEEEQVRQASAQRATGGSSMFAVRGRDGRAYLFNGPQLGFSAPELFVEYELHYPGVDLRGVSAAGVPVLGIGHNGKVAWGFTSGLSDEDDLYAEELVGDTASETYRFKGEERKMDCRDETFRYGGATNALIGGSAPEEGQVTERLCRTVHGPVQVRAGKTAYARRYAIWNREFESLVGLDMLNRATNIREIDTAMNNVSWNENVMAIDSEGNIGFWHPGLHQLRPLGFDERLPYPGTGEAEWRGLRKLTRTPRVINPKQGWLANWNNLPAKGWTSGDAEATERLSGSLHRGQFLARQVARLRKRGASFEGAQDLIRYVGQTAQQRPLAQPRLRAAAKGATGPAAQLLDALLNWNGSYHATDGAGTVDPGVAIWESFKDQLEERALRRFGKGAERLKGGTGSSHAFDISNGEAYALRVSRPKGYRAAAAATFAELAKRFGSDDVATWREPRRLYKWAIQGAQSPPDLPFFDRGTWEQFVETAP